MDIIFEFLSLGAMLALLFRLHPVAVLALLLTSVPYSIIGGYYSNRRFALITGRAPAQRMVSYLSGLLGSRDAVKEVRLFGLDKPFLERFRRFEQTFFDKNKEVWLSERRATWLLQLLTTSGTVAVWVYAVLPATLARISIGDLALVFQTVERSRNALGQLSLSVGMLYGHSLFLGNFFGFLELTPDSVEGALSPKSQTDRQPLKLPRPLLDTIEFRNVSFRYPGADSFALQDLSFTLQPGETIALVGENGAGKTALVKLLARLYDPTEGTILLDGSDLREYDLKDYRRQIGVIFQDFVRYQLSVQENIGFGQIELVDDRQRVAQAAEKGGARPMIEGLPKGFDTILGKTFDEGVDLSIGEWQKLALSRAFMREAGILILDEPTASLDALAEYEVYKRFADLAAGKTTILISHRFSTVRMAQHILVLHEGKLMEEGTHDELMAFGGHYAEMFTTQAERYR